MFGIGREPWIRALLAVSVAACKHGTCQHDRAAVTSATNAVAPTTLDSYERIVYGPGANATFVPTSVAEHEVIAQLVPRLLELASAGTLPESSVLDPMREQANAVGFRIETWTIGDDFRGPVEVVPASEISKGHNTPELGSHTTTAHYVALLEVAGKARGAGAYIFRIAPTIDEPAILIQAPHSYYDVGTGRLAAELFFTPRQGVRPRALFTNTIHRYQLAPGDKVKRKVNPADVAHNREHAFSIATQAFIVAAGDVRVIQLHGFGRRSDDGDGDGDTEAIEMVVSAGDAAKSSSWSAAIAAALVGSFGSGVKRFPEETNVLGATTNVQGQLVRARNANGFVHIEMSAEVRKQLGRDAALREKLARALFDSP